MSAPVYDQIDTFAQDNLPPKEQWPQIDLGHPAYDYPPMLNCTTRFLDHWVDMGEGHRPALRTEKGVWSYSELYSKVNRLARVLVEDMGLIPGNRVLLRSANNPMMVAAYLAVIRAGGIAVGTMPLLRAGELQTIANKAEITHALCDERLREALETAMKGAPTLNKVAFFNGAGFADLEAAMEVKPAAFEPYPTRSDETCLIAFTSGTTGAPKGTMHFHRDLLAICDGFSSLVLKPGPDDIFAGSPPLAFTFGLGGLALFALHAGASSLLLEAAPPPVLAEAIAKQRLTIVFTAPTAYRAMIPLFEKLDISSLKKAVSAGEHLPLATFEAFRKATGITLIDGLGSTEMLHIFITAAGADVRPGTIGKPVPGYRARIVDETGKELPRGSVGKLAVIGPTGCRYLADERQKNYVQNGWNLPGDACSMDEEGYVTYHARADDMIISAGYNISGPEVEDALLSHESVVECAVIGVADEERGQIVKAFVVLGEGYEAGETTAKMLQDHVKARIAPYKYPRQVEFLDALPKTASGKLQRFKLRAQA